MEEFEPKSSEPGQDNLPPSDVPPEMQVGIAAVDLRAGLLTGDSVVMQAIIDVVDAIRTRF